MQSKDEILDILRRLLPEVRLRYKVRGLVLFGSVARDEQVRESDVDILVDFSEGADLFDLTGLGCFLEDALQRKVDVVSKKALRKGVSETVFHDAIAV